MPRRSASLLQGLLAASSLVLQLTSCSMVPAQRLSDIDHPLAGRLWDPVTSSFTSEIDLLRRAASADVLLLGETHDNPEHHRLQRQIIAARRSGGAPPALLLEQFDLDQQPEIENALRQGGQLGSLMRGWDWSQYQALVEEARIAGMPIRAANLPRNSLRPVVRDGFGTLAAEEGQRLALQATWDADREKFMASVIEASHCGKISPQLRDGLVRAQRLRDATLADTALRHIEHGAIFILGRGHARRDVGVPRYIAVRRPDLRVLSIGLVEVSADKPQPSQYEAERVDGTPPYDLIWFTARAERADPCLAFGK